MSNAEISQTLFIAEQTTKTHVGRILMKLHLRDRAQAVVLAYESGLNLAPPIANPAASPNRHQPRLLAQPQHLIKQLGDLALVPAA